MRTNEVNRQISIGSVKSLNSRATEERARLFEGLERVVNCGDSREAYSQIAIAARSFWPLNVSAPTGKERLDRPIRWDEAGQPLFRAYRNYLRRIWVGDYVADNKFFDGAYLNYLLGLDTRFATHEPGQYIDLVLPDRAFTEGWAALKKTYTGAYVHSPAQVLPNWGASKLDYLATNDFQRAIFILLGESWRAKVCRRCGRYFIADKSAQAFCSTGCSGGNKRDRGLKYWREKGVLQRAARKQATRRQK
jgi:hypothetical protein